MTGKSHLPPVPPAGRAPQGRGKRGTDGAVATDRAVAAQDSKERIRAGQGREAEGKAKLTNQRYQQDR